VSTSSVSGRRLRHPAELPLYVFMVVLNLIIIGLILEAAISLPMLPERLAGSGWAGAVRSAFIGLLLLVPALVVVRETQRASVRARTAPVTARPHCQDLYQTMDDFAHRLGLPPAAAAFPPVHGSPIGAALPARPVQAPSAAMMVASSTQDVRWR
jgi:hypothetical protein